MKKYYLEENDLFENPTPRVPICLVLDTSYSMAGAPIKELNKGIKHFFSAIKEDDYTRYSAEIAIIIFGGTARKFLDFESIDKQKIPELAVNGGTPMGEALQIALTLLENRKKQYRKVGVDYYKPWLILMTDGRPTDNIDPVAKKISKMVNQKKLTIFPIGIGAQASLEALAKISPIRPPLPLQGLKFKEFFSWLRESISTVSSSIPGEKIPLDLEGLKAWAEV